MFPVIWRDPALDALADAYVVADLPTRAAIERAVTRLNAQLASDPDALDASITSRCHLFGLLTILNFGAGGESPIRQSSISNAKNSNSSLEMLFSQSNAARCSSVNCLATHTTALALKPAA